MFLLIFGCSMAFLFCCFLHQLKFLICFSWFFIFVSFQFCIYFYFLLGLLLILHFCLLWIFIGRLIYLCRCRKKQHAGDKEENSQVSHMDLVNRSAKKMIVVKYNLKTLNIFFCQNAILTNKTLKFCF